MKVIQIGRIDPSADSTMNHGVEEVHHFRTEFFRCDGINDDIHRMIEIHQNDTDDLDENQDSLSRGIVVIFEVFANAQKDHDRGGQTDEN